jgi:hypothetical protein
MTSPANPKRDKNHRYPGKIISHGVWLDDPCTLSYRDAMRNRFESQANMTGTERAA